MPDVDGISLLKEWGANGQLTMPVIMMSGHGTIDTAVEATKFGASAFLEKPITLQKLLRAVEQALARPGSGGAAPARSATGAAPSSNPLRLDTAPLTEHLGLAGHPPGQRQRWAPPPPPAAACPVQSAALTWTVRCARRGTRSRRVISSSTWPRKTAA